MEWERDGLFGLQMQDGAATLYFFWVTRDA
jgi:hypothetical protein